MSGGRGDVHGPVAGAAHVGVAALLKRLIGAIGLTISVVRLALRRLDLLVEHVVKALVGEVAFLLGDPFLQPEVRLDDELLILHAICHVDLHFVVAPALLLIGAPVRYGERLIKIVVADARR